MLYRIRLFFLLLLLCGLLLPTTSVFAQPAPRPTVIVISLDGFRPDYLLPDNTPTISRLAQNGVRAKWMIPVFPTKTFPNHYSIITGLYPAHHGIVENKFYDPVLAADFAAGRRPDVTDQRWWSGEPVWITAEKQGVRTAPLFWVGSEVAFGGIRPAYSLPFRDEMPGEARVDTLLAWLDQPPTRRPTFLTLYFSLTDNAGHRHGPDAPETRTAAHTADALIARLINGLTRRNLINTTNLIVVSDHGMAAVSPKRMIFLDDVLDMDRVERVFWGELTAIWPKPGQADWVYAALSKQPIPHLKVYRREDLPARFHYHNNPRIAPILCLPDAGWSVSTNDHFSRIKSIFMSGAHGYDNQDPSMRALFIVNGPAFRSGLVVEPFENVNVYPLICKLLNIAPAPVDGKLTATQGMLK